MPQTVERSQTELAFLESLRAHTRDYRPNSGVLAKMGAVSLVIVDGVTSAGKGTHLDRLFENADGLGVGGLHRVLSFTTRPRRPTEISGPDQYEAHLNIRRAAVRERLAHGLGTGAYVQAISHPTGEIYGSRVAAYRQRPTTCIAEFTAAECERLVVEGIFPDAQAICVVPHAGASWLERWFARDGRNPSGFGKRLLESQQSLDLGLHSDSHPTTFVTNAYGEDPTVPPAFESMAAVIRGDYSAELAATSQARAEELFSFINELVASQVEIVPTAKG